MSVQCLESVPPFDTKRMISSTLLDGNFAKIIELLWLEAARGIRYPTDRTRP